MLAVALCWMYRTPVLHPEKRGRYYTACGVGLLLSALACFAGMRGGLDPEQRPLHNGMAREYVTQPAKAVLDKVVIDSDIIYWVINQAGEGYQDKLNAMLRRAMEEERAGTSAR